MFAWLFSLVLIYDSTCYLYIGIYCIYLYIYIYIQTRDYQTHIVFLRVLGRLLAQL